VNPLDALIPSWVKLAAIGVLLVALVGAVFAIKSSWEAEGAAKIIAADQKAIAEQQAKDAKLSAEIVAKQAVELADLQNRAQTVITRIDNAPSTSGCGPVMRDASHGLRELFQRPGGAQTGRQLAPALSGPNVGS
jgi:hypothetical protein